MKTICSGLDAAVDTPGKGAAGLTKLALVFALAVSPLLLAQPTAAVDTLPILWEAGGETAGNDGAGQAARVAVDLTGNVAVVSGPSLARDSRGNFVYVSGNISLGECSQPVDRGVSGRLGDGGAERRLCGRGSQY